MRSSWCLLVAWFASPPAWADDLSDRLDAMADAWSRPRDVETARRLAEELVAEFPGEETVAAREVLFYIAEGTPRAREAFDAVVSVAPPSYAGWVADAGDRVAFYEVCPLVCDVVAARRLLERLEPAAGSFQMRWTDARWSLLAVYDAFEASDTWNFETALAAVEVADVLVADAARIDAIRAAGVLTPLTDAMSRGAWSELADEATGGAPETARGTVTRLVGAERAIRVGDWRGALEGLEQVSEVPWRSYDAVDHRLQALTLRAEVLQARDGGERLGPYVERYRALPGNTEDDLAWIAPWIPPLVRGSVAVLLGAVVRDEADVAGLPTPGGVGLHGEIALRFRPWSDYALFASAQTPDLFSFADVSGRGDVSWVPLSDLSVGLQRTWALGDLVLGGRAVAQMVILRVRGASSVDDAAVIGGGQLHATLEGRQWRVVAGGGLLGGTALGGSGVVEGRYRFGDWFLSLHGGVVAATPRANGVDERDVGPVLIGTALLGVGWEW